MTRAWVTKVEGIKFSTESEVVDGEGKRSCEGRGYVVESEKKALSGRSSLPDCSHGRPGR